MSDIFDNGNPLPPATADRWTPILAGDIYCSLACGSWCKLVEFEQGTASASALVAELGPGWKPRVWENGGWYFSAENGAATVDYSERGGNFTACIDAGVFNERHEQFRAEGSDPRAAMEAVLDQVKHKIASLKLTAVSAALEPLQIDDAA